MDQSITNMEDDKEHHQLVLASETGKDDYATNISGNENNTSSSSSSKNNEGNANQQNIDSTVPLNQSSSNGNENSGDEDHGRQKHDSVTLFSTRRPRDSIAGLSSGLLFSLLTYFVLV